MSAVGAAVITDHPWNGAAQHATPSAPDQLDVLPDRLRMIPALIERKRGTFYRRSHAALHSSRRQRALHSVDDDCAGRNAARARLCPAERVRKNPGLEPRAMTPRAGEATRHSDRRDRARYSRE
jgi:hypothetical protein